MGLLGDDGRGYELARKLESLGVWRTWLGDSTYANFVQFLASPSTWDSFMRVDDSKSRAQIQLQLRVRALLFDKATASLFFRSSNSSSSSSSTSLSSASSISVSNLNPVCESSLCLIWRINVLVFVIGFWNWTLRCCKFLQICSCTVMTSTSLSRILCKMGFNSEKGQFHLRFLPLNLCFFNGDLYYLSSLRNQVNGASCYAQWKRHCCENFNGEFGNQIEYQKHIISNFSLEASRIRIWLFDSGWVNLHINCFQLCDIWVQVQLSGKDQSIMQCNWLLFLSIGLIKQNIL